MIGINDFTTLTFDCYGTLIDWERGIFAELRPWADLHGRQDLDDNVLLETFGSTEAACEVETPGMLYPQILEKCTVDWLGGGASDRPWTRSEASVNRSLFGLRSTTARRRCNI